MAKKYLVGIDLGTDSCGWCLTDETGKIVRKNGKCLWGARLFEESESCAERRSFRSDRRRLQRRNERIKLLQNLLEDEITKVDNKFYIKLNESKLLDEDRSYRYDYNFLEDKEYNKKYPTISHLRYHLLVSNQKEDIRLIYLAVANILKNRGHFLFEGANFSSSGTNEIIECFETINNCLEEIGSEKMVEISDNILNKLLEANKNVFGISKKKYSFDELINPNKDKFVKDVLVSLLAGGTVSISKIVDTKENEYDEFKDIDCNKEDFDLIIQSLGNNFPSEENKIKCLIEIKKVYDFLLLNKILKNSTYISEAMIKDYEKHKEELILLKKYIKLNHKEVYNEVFRLCDKDINNYCAYVGSTNSNNVVIRFKHCSAENFYKYLKKVLGLDKYRSAEEIENQYLKNIYLEMQAGTYLSRQNNSNNRVIPYQINLKELEVILDKQSKFYPSLLVKDQDGLSIIDKIKSIMVFKIPYYVGPLSTHSSFGWISRSNEKIYPWNFNKVVNIPETAEKFITRMQNKCSYLDDKFCLPKDSIIYNKYIILNEINKFSVNGQPITFDDKQDLIKKVYYKKPIVKKKDLEKFFKARYGENVVVSTSSGKELNDISGTLKPFIQLANIFGEKYVDENIDLMENLIRENAIFEEKKIYKERLINTYHITDQKKINSLLALRFTGFGRLSKEFLLDLRGVDANGEIIDNGSIMDILMSTNKNLMEIINDQSYGFKDSIELHNKNEIDIYKKKGEDGVTEYIEKLFVSPGIKRPLIQAYKIINELERIVNHPIDEYYIECTRSNKSKKEKKKSRKDKLLEMYDAAITLCADSEKKELEELKKNIIEKEDSLFRSDVVYLYFTQLGKDVYTGKTIDFDSAIKGNGYDIDHIFPQSVIKDDSLTNRVLVSSVANSLKTDIFPIPYQKLAKDYNPKPFLSLLRSLRLIPEEKFNRLTRNYPLEDSEIFNFVNRQIVYTSQSVKALKDLVLSFKKNANGEEPLVILSKAEVVSDFRKNFDLLKARDANDAHHAHDAFLNIMVGRTVDCYFKHVACFGRTTKNGKTLTTNVDKIFYNYNSEGVSKDNIFDNGENLVWNYQDDATLKYIIKEIKHNYNILFTTRTYVKPGILSKTSLKPVTEFKDGGYVLPLKDNENFPSVMNDYHKYSGYTDLSFGSYTLYKSTGKHKEDVYTLVAIPNAFLNDEKRMQNYIESQYKFVNPEIVLSGLKVNTVFVTGKSKYCITGKTGQSFLIKNLNECFYEYKYIETIRKVSKMFDMMSGKYDFKKFMPTIKNGIPLINRLKDNDTLLLSPAKNSKTTEICIYRQELLDLLKEISRKLSKDIYKKYTSFENLSTSVMSLLSENSDIDMYRLVILCNEMLHLTQNNRTSSNLSVIDLNANSGTLKISSKLDSSTKIIYESITGFYSKVVWELK